MLEQQISSIIEQLKASNGTEFFNRITQQLDAIIEADFTFIARLDNESKISRTISLVAKGEITENFEYSLDYTPCADVADDSMCVYPKNICSLYPKDQLLIDMQVEGYIGSPLHDSSGEVIGILVALYQRPIENIDLVTNLFELFSGRISAEIERSEKEQQLVDLNKTLEDKVSQRTTELSKALENLKSTQRQIVEQEKLASLGRLVAGVAHEINTPLGVAILGSSTMKNIVKNLYKKIESGELKKTELESKIDDLFEAQNVLEYNLQRAAELVANFKQIAVEQNTDELTKVDLDKWLHTLISSLQPMVKKQGIKIALNTPEKPTVITSYPAKISQVITNLVTNAAVHAFENKDDIEKIIEIDLFNHHETYSISVCDNGCGMTEEVKEQIFEPFFTTKRGCGGTGLGMSIVNNLVKRALQGELLINSNRGQGSKFTLTLPQKVN